MTSPPVQLIVDCPRLRPHLPRLLAPVREHLARLGRRRPRGRRPRPGARVRHHVRLDTLMVERGREERAGGGVAPKVAAPLADTQPEEGNVTRTRTILAAGALTSPGQAGTASTGGPTAHAATDGYLTIREAKREIRGRQRRKARSEGTWVDYIEVGSRYSPRLVRAATSMSNSATTACARARCR